MRKILVAEDAAELNNIAAKKFVETANAAIANRGRFTVALAGGSTPKSLYRLLAGPEFKDKVDWAKVFFFFGDERCVPPTSAESNFRMAKENLFDLLGTPSENIFRWQTGESTAEAAAGKYEETLRNFFSAPYYLDLVLLGMGADGHTASLFPFSPALAETSRLAVSNWVEKLGAYRLTMTFPTINSAANIIFLVAGEEKAPALKEILEGESRLEKYPAQGVSPERSNLYWIVDKAAARLLAE